MADAYFHHHFTRRFTAHKSPDEIPAPHRYAVTSPSAMGRYNLPRSIDPPPSKPKLDTILLLGDPSEACTLGRQLAKDLGQGYVHLDTFLWLRDLHVMPDGKGKSAALGLLHPAALEDFVDGKTRSLSPRLVVDVVLRRVEQLVADHGARKFVVTGFRHAAEMALFRTTIARPDAVVWVEGGGRRGVRENLEEHFGRGRVLVVERGEDRSLEGLVGVYKVVLGRIGEKVVEGGGVLVERRDEMEDAGVVREDVDEEMAVDEEVEVADEPESVEEDRVDTPREGVVGQWDAMDELEKWVNS